MKRPLAIIAAGAVAVTLALAGCGTGSSEEAKDVPRAFTEVEEGAYPVTIEHAFGETTVTEEPKRVVTIGWTDQDNALSLGVIPVGSTKLTWGGNDAGSSDWFDAEIAQYLDKGSEAPVRFDDTDGVPTTEISKLAPDLILATNSGLTQEDYDDLVKIAPVVAFPEAPWVTPWQKQMEMVSAALGRPELGKQVIAETEKAIQEASAAHPQLEGKSVIFGYLTTTDMSTIGIYAPQDPRVSLMHDFGLVDAPIVAQTIKEGEFYGQLSAERATEVDSDVFLTWAENADDQETFAGHNLLGQIPAIKAGHFYAEADKHVSLAVTNPSPVSIPYIIEHFVPEIAKAIDGS
ncbi:iron-siderophore ABC transporter substrate-binding protein [Nocardioides sp. AE5]|uniref:iron-siderophore ABC transporter substrate-binding protein n=1 Tax=Nocardioides sp. AE5 TaxID=2962573 RepID=UPI002881CD61|nr:iron-siderophore ABC transporter substrate-binding protein [Nocardioides sp. AE5]MDT0203476.1 iron-siderophore ABC transporter substrate-binding protein [Nocardioides sp. AE5]